MQGLVYSFSEAFPGWDDYHYGEIDCSRGASIYCGIGFNILRWECVFFFIHARIKWSTSDQFVDVDGLGGVEKVELSSLVTYWLDIPVIMISFYILLYSIL